MKILQDNFISSPLIHPPFFRITPLSDSALPCNTESVGLRFNFWGLRTVFFVVSSWQDRNPFFFCCTDFSCCTETLMSTKFITKLNMTWLDNVNEQHRSFSMRVRSLGVGGRDLWCVKGAKNVYEMIQCLIAFPFFIDFRINLWQKVLKVTLSCLVTDQKWKLKFATPTYCSPSFIAHKSKNKYLNPFTPWSD